MFSEDEIERYSRHILLPDIGGAGQARLRNARVLIVGAGGLGSPLALYLAAGGIGHITIADDDTVALSNLQRQIAHGMPDLGRNKAESAADAARRINPLVTVQALGARIGADNAAAMVAAHDIVCDGSDNFATRYLLGDACWAAGRVLVSASVLRFEGQVFVSAPRTACYRCVYPEAPPPALAPSCAEAGVLGAVTGVLGAMQAAEVLKIAAGLPPALAGRLLLWDALTFRSRIVSVKRDPACALCGVETPPRSADAGLEEG